MNAIAADAGGASVDTAATGKAMQMQSRPLAATIQQMGCRRCSRMAKGKAMQKMQLQSRPLAATIRQMRSGRCSRMANGNGHLPEATMPMLQLWPHRWVLTSPHRALAVQLCHWPLAVHQASFDCALV